jgi:hypothetical protein
MRLNIVPKSLWKALITKNLMNDLDLINVPQIWKPKLSIKN